MCCSEVRLAPRLADCGLLVVAGHVVPLDAVSVEVVQDAKTGLLVGGNLSSSSVVRLREASSSSV